MPASPALLSAILPAIPAEAQRPRWRGVAARLVVRLAVLALLGWGLGVVVLHVAPGLFHAHVDRPVNHWMHHHRSGAARAVLSLVAAFGSQPVLAVVVMVAGLSWWARRRSGAPFVTLALAYGGAAAVSLAVKLAVQRGASGIAPGLAGATQLAFPSGHATLGAAVYGTAAILLSRPAGPDPAIPRSPGGRWRRTTAAAGLVVLAVTIGVARVYNGQHDPTDVLAGWLLGALWARAVTSGLRSLGPAGRRYVVGHRGRRRVQRAGRLTTLGRQGNTAQQRLRAV